LGKVVWEGVVDVDGEAVFITVKRGDRLPGGGYQLYAEGFYLGEHFMIDDHGYGLDYLKDLVKLRAQIIKGYKQKSQS
jgi:hypothetical protein